MPVFRVSAIVAAAIISTSASASAQELDIPPASFPALAQTAGSAEAFVPADWVLEAQAEGDLNKDGLPDLVFVLHQANPENLLGNANGTGSPEIDTNPRILAAAFRTGDTYRLVLENHTLIPRHETPTLEDPFDPEGALTVERGAFSVILRNFSNAGGWEMGDAKLTFRYQDERIELIGWDRSTIARNTGETVETSANFSTGTLTTSRGSIEHDRKDVSAKKLTPPPLDIETVGDGLLFGSGAEGAPGPH